MGGVRRLGKSSGGSGSRCLLTEEATEAWLAGQQRGGALGRSSGAGREQKKKKERWSYFDGALLLKPHETVDDGARDGWNG
jgi:hypothetical protein